MASYRRKTARLEWGADRQLFRYTPGDDLTLLGATFERASIATYLDVNGVRHQVASGVVRDAHYTSIGGTRRLLIERASTNRCPRSEELSNTTYWVASDLNVTANAAIGPDNAQTADRLVAAATTAPHFLNHQTFVSVAGVAYTFSIDVRPDQIRYVQLLFSSGEVAANPRVNFDLQTGLITAQDSSIVGHIRPLANGFFRISARATAAGTDITPILALVTSGTAARGESWLGDGVSGVFAVAGQFEDLPYATSYIPTTAGTVTRPSEVLHLPAGFNVQALTLFAEFEELGTAGYTPEASGVLGLGVADNPSVFLLSGGAGSYYAVHRRASDVYPGGVLPTVTVGQQVRLRAHLSATGTINAHQSLDGGAESSMTESAALGLAGGAWNLDRIDIGGRGGVPGSYAFRGLAIAMGDVGMDRMTALARGGRLFANTCTFGYPLDEAVSFSRPAEGSEMVFLPSGVVDGWDTGETHVLQATVRWIPTEDTVTPAATGWNGDLGVRACLAHLRRGNPCWLSPDVSDLTAGWTMHLEAPFADAPELEVDMTRRVALVLRSTTPIEGY